MKARWGVTLRGGEGFRAIGELIGSRVEYRRGDALALSGAGERFDLIFCFGILHRVENPLGLLRGLAGLLSPGGRVLVETYGIAGDGRLDRRIIGPARERGDRRLDRGRAPADPGDAHAASELTPRSACGASVGTASGPKRSTRAGSAESLTVPVVR